MMLNTIISKKDKELVTIHPDNTLRDAVILLYKHKIGGLPCVDSEGGLIGIVTERDLVYAMAKHGEKAHSIFVADVMTKDVYASTENEDPLFLLRVMTESHFRHIPVVTEGELKAMISIGDLVKYILESN